MDVLLNFSFIELCFVALVFIWTGFVRSGLGFGGGALGLPLMLFIYDQPLFWLPVIGFHLLFFSSLTLRSRISKVDWLYLKKAILIIIPFVLVGVLGLIKLPTNWLLVFIYSITLLYAILWVSGLNIRSNNKWVDRFLLCIGGYVAGTSLTGAPLIVAVFLRHVSAAFLRNTLFVLWFSIVMIKMTAFIVVGIDLNLITALTLIPVATIGHIIGLKAHDKIIQNDALFKRLVGAVLILISSLGLYNI
ncbi:MAG: permease [endosymbiont of Galathealinum brachiosum]|uniref:Probable membrane transporter protein n=1 Tax=endosymbiont of Galathealinum brachiosum TaxID=2200906 RepID=A0A370DCV1_9GAMM|nr:MAG: permease [endosymbiont of Galathealinum brachiosum]